MIELFKSAKEVNEYYQSWCSVTESKRLQSIRDHRNIGVLSIKMSGDPVVVDFKCPLHGFGLARSCRLSSCQYYVGPKEGDRPFESAQAEAAADCKNCLINCLYKSKNARLSALEVSNLVGVSVSEVNNTNAHAVSKIRRATIKESIEKYHIPRFKYLSGFCVCCEVSIKDELEMGMKPEFTLVHYQHGWCCSACKEEKPKWQFFIEREFHCDYLDALASGFLSYKSIDSLGSVFGVSNDLLKGIKDMVIERAERIKQTMI